MSEVAIQMVLAAVASVVGGTGSPPLLAPAPVPTSPPRPLVQNYGQSVHLSLAAVAQGMPVAAALAAFAQVSSGQFSHDDKCFLPENVVLGPVANRVCLLPGAERRVIRGCEGKADIPLFLVHGVIAALACGKRLCSQWLEDEHRDSRGLESLPDLIALPRDAHHPNVQGHGASRGVGGVGYGAWHAGRGHTLDHERPAGHALRLCAVAADGVAQPSWENDEDAKRALWPVMAKWLASGVLEYVAWDDCTPILLQPCGAVPKGSAPFYRLITDARFAKQVLFRLGSYIHHSSATQQYAESV
jgi:hypothetical protein